MHAIPALGRLRLNDGEIQTSLDYVVRHRLKKKKANKRKPDRYAESSLAGATKAQKAYFNYSLLNQSEGRH